MPSGTQTLRLNPSAVLAWALVTALPFHGTALRGQEEKVPPPPAGPAQPLETPAPAPGEGILLPKNLLLDLEIVQAVSTRTAKPDDFFDLRVAKALVLEDRTVIPAGTRAMGQVIDSQGPGIFGQPARLLVAIRFLELGGQKVPLRLYNPSQGKDRTTLGMVAGMAVGVFGAFVRGGHVDLAPGQLLTAKIAKDTLVVASPPAPPLPSTPIPEKGTTP